MQLTPAILRQACMRMLELEIVPKGYPVIISFDENWWYPFRFYLPKDDNTTIQQMIHGPIYHNDNHN